MPKWLIAAHAVLMLLTWSAIAHGYPGMIRHGLASCGLCHADPSGGELLTTYGRIQGSQLLASRYTAPHGAYELERSPGPLWNLLSPPEWLLLGGAYRHALYAQTGSAGGVSHFPMMMDLFGWIGIDMLRASGSVGLARIPAGSPHVRPAQVTRNQGDQWNLLSRWHWLGVELGETTLIRGGRLNLPFGIRIPEHTAWIREVTRTDGESDQQHGVAITYAGGELRAELMAILGNYQLSPDRFRERGYSLYVEGLLQRAITLGVSSKLTRAEADLITLEEAAITRQAHGVSSRWSPDAALVALAEVDVLLASRRDLGYVGFLQVDVMPLQGLHFYLTGEILDRGFVERQADLSRADLDRVPGVGLPKAGAWFSAAWYFFPQLELRLDTIARYDDPIAILAQLHFYL